MYAAVYISVFFFFNDTATTEIYTLSLHDALPICPGRARRAAPGRDSAPALVRSVHPVGRNRRLRRPARLGRAGAPRGSGRSRPVHDPAARTTGLAPTVAPRHPAVPRRARPGRVQLSLDPSRSPHGRAAARRELAGGAG